VRSFLIWLAESCVSMFGELPVSLTALGPTTLGLKMLARAFGPGADGDAGLPLQVRNRVAACA
jgi:hypothetical protein